MADEDFRTPMGPIAKTGGLLIKKGKPERWLLSGVKFETWGLSDLTRNAGGRLLERRSIT